MLSHRTAARIREPALRQKDRDLRQSETRMGAQLDFPRTTLNPSNSLMFLNAARLLAALPGVVESAPEWA
jgi:hypothetical protein